MTRDDILEYMPLSGRFACNSGATYEYDVIDREEGLIHFSINGEPLKEVKLDDAPEDFRRELREQACKLAAKPIIEAQLGGRKIKVEQLADYATAWRYLHTGENAFLKFCAGIIGDYHALDRELTQTLLLGMTRASYSGVSALTHFDCTGATGAGKNDLVNRVTALIPARYLDLFSTVSPTALLYETLIRESDVKGRTRIRVNKERFRNKIICITEVADAAGYASLKALAEIEESAEFTHMATVNGESVKMTITGPRCVITTSVEGVKDAQVKRRFIHASMPEDSLDNQLEKLELIEEILREDKDIRNDPRVAIAQAGFDLIFSTQGVVFEQMDGETVELLKRLDVLFLNSGYSMTNIKQFFTLCQCSALWKRFERGHTRIEVEDVCEAWFLLSTFERETITKTTREGIETLKAIMELCEEYDEKSGAQTVKYDNSRPERPTRREIIKASNVPQAQVYRLLRTKEDEQGKLGEILELGYAVNQYRERQTVFELTDLGKAVLRPVQSEVTVNEKYYEPIEPLEVGDVTITLRPLGTVLRSYPAFSHHNER